MNISSFVRVICPLKNPSNACLCCLDNGYLMFECSLFRLPNVIGVLPVSRHLTSEQMSHQIKTLKYLSNIKALLTYYGSQVECKG